jgi:hypothetical protein
LVAAGPGSAYHIEWYIIEADYLLDPWEFSKKYSTLTAQNSWKLVKA